MSNPIEGLLARAFIDVLLEKAERIGDEAVEKMNVAFDIHCSGKPMDHIVEFKRAMDDILDGPTIAGAVVTLTFEMLTAMAREVQPDIESAAIPNLVRAVYEKDKAARKEKAAQ